MKSNAVLPGRAFKMLHEAGVISKGVRKFVIDLDVDRGVNVKTNHFVKELVEAGVIPPESKRFTVTVEQNRVVKVEVKGNMTSDAYDLLLDTIASYPALAAQFVTTEVEGNGE